MNKTIVKIAKTLIPAIAVPATLNTLIFQIAKHSDKRDFEKDARIKESFFEWKHAKVRYVDAGSGTPLILIHNTTFGGSLYEWEDVIFQLAEHFHVYAVDLPGFGHSQKTTMTYTVYFYVSLMNDFLKRIVKKKAHIVASGYAAPIAVFAAEMDEQYISSVLLVSPSGIFERKMPRNGDVWRKWILNVPVIGTSFHNIVSSKFFIRRFLKKQLMLEDQFVNKNIGRIYYPAHTGGRRSKSATVSRVTKYLNVSIEHKLYSPAVPTHIIWCRGCSAGLNQMFEIIKESRNLSVSVFKSSYAAPQLETPEKFVACCVNFFNRVLSKE